MLLEPNCSKRKCIHFLGASENENEEEQVCVCQAFRNGIPNDIAYGDNLHLEPVEGDNGIVYEKDE